MTDIETLQALVEQGLFADARDLVTERGPALFIDLTRTEFVALTDMLVVVDQAAEGEEADRSLALSTNRAKAATAS